MKLICLNDDAEMFVDFTGIQSVSNILNQLKNLFNLNDNNEILVLSKNSHSNELLNEVVLPRGIIGAVIDIAQSLSGHINSTNNLVNIDGSSYHKLHSNYIIKEDLLYIQFSDETYEQMVISCNDQIEAEKIHIKYLLEKIEKQQLEKQQAVEQADEKILQQSKYKNRYNVLCDKIEFFDNTYTEKGQQIKELLKKKNELNQKQTDEVAIEIAKLEDNIANIRADLEELEATDKIVCDEMEYLYSVIEQPMRGLEVKSARSAERPRGLASLLDEVSYKKDKLDSRIAASMVPAANRVGNRNRVSPFGFRGL